MALSDINSLHRRIFHGIGAQTFSRIVQIVIRLGEIPLFMAFWGPQRYGEWLMLFTLPAYLSIGDGGFSTAACREMTMRSGADDTEGTLAVFQSTWVFLLLISSILVLIVIVFVNTIPLADWLGLKTISQSEVKIVLLILIVYVLMGFQGGLINGIFWVSGNYPFGMILTATIQLLEFGGLVLAVVLGGGPIQAALGYTIGRLLGIIIQLIFSRKVTPWLTYGFSHASFKEMRNLALPAFASLAFPLGNALNTEGMRLLVGLVISPMSVAIFVPLRTLSRLATQPRIVINQIIQPELALTYGTNDNKLLCRLFLQSCQLAFWTCLVAGVFLILGGKFVLPIWTLGKITMHWPLFILLVSAVALNGLWYTALMVAYSTNRHGHTAMVYILVYGGLAFVLGFIGANVMQLTGVGIALVITEGLMAVYVIGEACRLSDVQFNIWIKTVTHPPLALAYQGAKFFYAKVKQHIVGTG